MKETGFDNEADLDETIKKLEANIQRARNKELGIDETDDKVRSNFREIHGYVLLACLIPTIVAFRKFLLSLL